MVYYINIILYHVNIQININANILMTRYGKVVFKIELHNIIHYYFQPFINYSNTLVTNCYVFALV